MTLPKIILPWWIETEHATSRSQRLPQKSQSYEWTWKKHILTFNPFKPEFTIVILIHYKPRIAAAIFDL